MQTLYITIAWRYFRAKKSANAINIISWLTMLIIAFAACCLILVLSVFNGFESLVKDMYSNYYADLRIEPKSGKSFLLSDDILQQLKTTAGVKALSRIVEERALVQNAEKQAVVTIKGVDEAYNQVSGLPAKITSGAYKIKSGGDASDAVIGSGVQDNLTINMNDVFENHSIEINLPKKTESNQLTDALSKSVLPVTGVFSIQQDIDNNYVITDYQFMQQQLDYNANEFTAIELKHNTDYKLADVVTRLQNTLGTSASIKTRYQQNQTLYATMKSEKVAIFLILSLLLIIAAFNMISALTMLVLEKKKDISVYKSMGMTNKGIQKIFVSEGFILAVLGITIGYSIAAVILFAQQKWHFFKLQGSTFVIDYFPVKVYAGDFIIVAATALLISLIASYVPAKKASKLPIELN